MHCYEKPTFVYSSNENKQAVRMESTVVIQYKYTILLV